MPGTTIISTTDHYPTRKRKERERCHMIPWIPSPSPRCCCCLVRGAPGDPNGDGGKGGAPTDPPPAASGSGTCGRHLHSAAAAGVVLRLPQLGPEALLRHRERAVRHLLA
uniref:ABAH2 n=1 Tax=Arundo donax TaxID=35708 RepID=A0A0A9HMT8_ARUDO